MPSPVAHSLAGIAVSWLADVTWPVRPRPRPDAQPTHAKGGLVARMGGRLALVAAFLGAAPDLDLAFQSHRTFTHSVGAAMIVFAVAALVAWKRRLPIVRTALVCSLACATHILLDWVGSDRAVPRGVMAFWPFDSTFYYAPIRLFPNVSRSYWLPLGFVYENTIALVCELAVVGTPVLLLWRVRVKALAALSSQLPGGHHPAE